MTTFADNLFIIRFLCPVLALGLTVLLCRHGRRAVEVVEEEAPSGWERREAEDTGREYYERRENYDANEREFSEW